MQFLNSYGFSELNCGGTGLIMTQVAIQFKKELFYGTPLKISIAPQKNSNAGFVLFYKVEFRQNDQYLLAVAAQTEMICYNYDLKKITRIPPDVIEKLNLMEIQ
jgi:acyl-CoA thioesterase FadM